MRTGGDARRRLYAAAAALSVVFGAAIHGAHAAAVNDLSPPGSIGLITVLPVERDSSGAVQPLIGDGTDWGNPNRRVGTGASAQDPVRTLTAAASAGATIIMVSDRS